MNDPYSVLGVSPNATEDQIKAAYRELARKYHPDNYVNNPLSDLAQEKMKEINEAYDEAVKRPKNGGAGGSSYTGTGGGSSNSSFGQIRNDINAGRLDQADAALNSVPRGQRDAEWHFLKGSVAYKRGWFNEAYGFFQTAVSMNPGNPEYQMAFQNMQRQNVGQQNTGYNPYGYNNMGMGNRGGCSACDFCAGMMCADLCCDCGGGGC